LKWAQSKSSSGCDRVVLSFFRLFGSTTVRYALCATVQYSTVQYSTYYRPTDRPYVCDRSNLEPSSPPPSIHTHQIASSIPRKRKKVMYVYRACTVRYCTVPPPTISTLQLSNEKVNGGDLDEKGDGGTHPRSDPFLSQRPKSMNQVAHPRH